MTDTFKFRIFIHYAHLDKPEFEVKQIDINPNLDYNSLRQFLYSYFGLKEEDDKVIKIRNQNLILVPLTNLTEVNSSDNFFIIDIAKIQDTTRSTVNLQDAYLDAVRQKIKNMESRVAKVESLMPQIQLRRQAHMEETVQNMSTRVAFLNKRIDDLTPPQWKSKMPVTIS
ncbi:uncharacterized protein LOC116163755 isoform X2 [Photinus pyralis]|uniref:uncharacterized protein LOC116163083 isoform X2 n=1 Tax=Photinus pyralis TaxID=7054 RepID=UPI001266FDA5|nr:uncharacterized protein LOC116163083 isoform X2 [Photinus pyralis]XP_031333718.1 uncharacterized protein LOC116163755 isoform X2 [Photinus pyralis]